MKLRNLILFGILAWQTFQLVNCKLTKTSSVDEPSENELVEAWGTLKKSNFDEADSMFSSLYKKYPNSNMVACGYSWVQGINIHPDTGLVLFKTFLENNSSAENYSNFCSLIGAGFAFSALDEIDSSLKYLSAGLAIDSIPSHVSDRMIIGKTEILERQAMNQLYLGQVTDFLETAERVATNNPMDKGDSSTWVVSGQHYPTYEQALLIYLKSEVDIIQ